MNGYIVQQEALMNLLEQSLNLDDKSSDIK